MNSESIIKELDKKIMILTDSEKYYLQNPGGISKKYLDIPKVDVKGKNVFFFDIPGLDFKDFEITKNSRFTTVPEHIHATLHMSYIYSGACTFNVDGKEITLTENDVCFIDRNVIRSKKYLGEHDVVISIHFSKNFLTSNFLTKLSLHSFFSTFIASAISEDNPHSNYLFLKIGKNEKIRNLFINLIHECYETGVFTNEILSSYLSIIMIELIRINKRTPSEQVINISEEKNDDIIDIMAFIENNFRTCTLDTLSQEFGYNKKYISQLIKSKAGIGFKDIQILHRLKHAAHLLETTEISIQEISCIIGINNENFFYKKFKIHYGKTPKDFRREYSFRRTIEQKLV